MPKIAPIGLNFGGEVGLGYLMLNNLDDISFQLNCAEGE